MVALGLVVLAASSGLLARAVGGIGATLSNAVAKIGAAPSPSPTAEVAADAPVLDVPGEPYTNQATADISGTIPGRIVGNQAYRIRLYVTVGSKPPVQVAEQPVGQSVAFTFPGVTLASGTNTFTATIVGPSSESEASAAVSFVLDKKAPPLTITAPKANATINRGTVTVTGRTQARSEIAIRNAASNATATGTAGADGAFAVPVALDPGTNELTVTATDPAGNAKSVTVSVRRGSGKMTAQLGASRYRFSASALPEPITVRVAVLDPDGKPLEGAAVTFTISVSGVPTITAQGTTDASGRASFSTTIPKGAMPGTGPAAVLVHSDEYGDTTDRVVITISKT